MEWILGALIIWAAVHPKSLGACLPWLLALAAGLFLLIRHQQNVKDEEARRMAAMH